MRGIPAIRLLLGAAVFTLVFVPGPAGARTIKQEQPDRESWKAVPDLPIPLTRHRAVLLGDSLVVTGGRDRQGKAQARAWVGKLRGGGALDVWKAGADMPMPVSDHAVCVAGGRLVVTGGLVAGRSGDSSSDQAWTADASADGMVKRWLPSARLPDGVYGHGAVALGKRVYLVGGFRSGAPSSVILRGEVGPDGVIREWDSVAPLPVAVANAAVVVVGKYLVVAGGQGAGESKTLVLPTVYVAPIWDNGGITMWYLDSTRFPGAWLGYGRMAASAVFYRNSLMCFGGQDSLWFLVSPAAVTVVDIEKGETAGWGLVETTETVPQVTQAVAWKEFVYLIGGMLKGKVTAAVMRTRMIQVDREEVDPR